MARPTRKHHLETLLWDTKNHSWSADIYSSGGVTHTVYIEVINDSGETVDKYHKTFCDDNARRNAHGWAREQRAYSTHPKSKYMQPKINNPAELTGWLATEISQAGTRGSLEMGKTMDAIYYASLLVAPGSILASAFSNGYNVSVLFIHDSKYILVSSPAPNEVAETLF